MGVYRVCEGCGCLYSLDTQACRKCQFDLSKSTKFKVQNTLRGQKGRAPIRTFRALTDAQEFNVCQRKAIAAGEKISGVTIWESIPGTSQPQAKSYIGPDVTFAPVAPGAKEPDLTFPEPPMYSGRDIAYLTVGKAACEFFAKLTNEQRKHQRLTKEWKRSDDLKAGFYFVLYVSKLRSTSTRSPDLPGIIGRAFVEYNRMTIEDEGKPLGKQTINNIRASLRAMFNFFLTADYCRGVNPMEGFDLANYL